jgi:hypothetical protein
MQDHRSIQRDQCSPRRGVATLEFVMALPILFVLMICILWEGFWMIGRAEVITQARNDTWKKRFDDASGDPLLFPVLTSAFYHQDKDYANEKASTKLEIKPPFHVIPDPQASNTILAGSWDYRAMSFEKPPHLKLMATAAAIGTGGNLLDWLGQGTNPLGLLKKFQSFGKGVKSESDDKAKHVGEDDGSTDSGSGTAPPPAPDGKTPEQAKEETEAKRKKEIDDKKEEYKRLGGRIPMFGPQAGQVIPERGLMRQAYDEKSQLQDDRAKKFIEMDQETDKDKKKKLQDELAQLQRKIDLTDIRYRRLEQEFLDVDAELDALGVNAFERAQI